MPSRAVSAGQKVPSMGRDSLPRRADRTIQACGCAAVSRSGRASACHASLAGVGFHAPQRDSVQSRPGSSSRFSCSAFRPPLPCPMSALFSACIPRRERGRGPLTGTHSLSTGIDGSSHVRATAPEARAVAPCPSCCIPSDPRAVDALALRSLGLPSVLFCSFHKATEGQRRYTEMPNKSVQTNSRPPLRFEALQAVQMSECRSRFLSAAVADLCVRTLGPPSYRACFPVRLSRRM